MLFWAHVSAKSSCFRHAVTPGESGVALFHKWCDKRVTPTEKMGAHWPVNECYRLFAAVNDSRSESRVTKLTPPLSHSTKNDYAKNIRPRVRYHARSQAFPP
jgi:hypothetical protein